MNQESRYSDVDNIFKNLDKRKPVIVGEDGKLYEAEKFSEDVRRDPDRRGTQLKPQTWYRLERPVPEFCFPNRRD